MILVGILLLVISFVVLIRYLTNSGISNSNDDDTIIVELEASGRDIKISNPAQSTNFADIGANVYVSDERQLGRGVGFSMTYFAESNSFAIDISGKPTEEYRRKAGAYLLESLQITEAEACQLRVYLGVSHSVDPNLSGRNLGLSFCPGSVEL